MIVLEKCVFKFVLLSFPLAWMDDLPIGSFYSTIRIFYIPRLNNPGLNNLCLSRLLYCPVLRLLGLVIRLINPSPILWIAVIPGPAAIVIIIIINPVPVSIIICWCIRCIIRITIIITVSWVNRLIPVIWNFPCCAATG